MRMRYIEDITIEKAILHIIDSNSDEPILANKELEINDNIYEFLYKHIVNGLNDFKNITAKFFDSSKIYNVSNNIILGEDFIYESKEIAIKLFNVLKKYPEIPSCDLLICKFSSFDSSFVAILKLDYQTSFVHEVEYEEEGFLVNMTTQETSLPGLNQKITNAAFISNNADLEYDMIVINKLFKTSDNELIDFFLKEFLEAAEVVDDTSATHIIKDSIEKWVRRNLKDEIDKAIEIREEINEKFVENGTLNIVDTIEEVIDDYEKKENFKEELERKGISIDKVIDIDKKWVEKKLKNKTIKTDTGFSIKADSEFFKDKMRFEIKYNGDGSVNYIIKNVRNIRE